MDLRSPHTEHAPEVDRAVIWSWVAGLATWAVGGALFLAGWASGSEQFFVAFTVWYVAMAAVVGFVARIPRVRQRKLDRSWAERFHQLAIHDDLTGLYNRRYFCSELERRISESRSNGRPLTIALIDLNDFKAVNDSFGHQAGDTALQMAAASILQAAGPESVVARTGGDEFAVILPGHTLAEGSILVEALSVELEAASLAFDASRGGKGWIRAAVGLATLNGFSEAQQLLHQADDALYARKAEMGRLYERRKAS